MLISRVVLCLMGLLFGASLSAGVLALISSLGIIPRMVGKSSTAAHILLYENFVMAGAVIGNVLTVFPGITIPVGNWLLVLFGVFSGIFVGCLATALAEVLQVWPILFRRSNTKYGLNLAMICFALGKLSGSLLFFLYMKS